MPNQQSYVILRQSAGIKLYYRGGHPEIFDNWSFARENAKVFRDRDHALTMRDYCSANTFGSPISVGDNNA